jgi:anti-sigma factor RsiW
VNAPHLDESAELYALGALEPEEQLAAERHLAICDACAVRVGEAAAVAAALGATVPTRTQRPVERRRARWSAPLWIGAAALVLLTFGLTTWYERSTAPDSGRTEVALGQLVHSHFLHVAMDKRALDSPSAKVIYGRDGSWVYVIVDRPDAGLHLNLGSVTTAMHDVGALHAGGGVATLFVAHTDHPTLAALEGPSGVIGTAILVYPPEPVATPTPP